MNTFNLFNLTNPILTIPITIIMGLGFIVVLLIYLKTLFSQIQKARRVGILEKHMAFSEVD